MRYRLDLPGFFFSKQGQECTRLVPLFSDLSKKKKKMTTTTTTTAAAAPTCKKTRVQQQRFQAILDGKSVRESFTFCVAFKTVCDRKMYN